MLCTPFAPFPNVLMSAADFPHVRMLPSESPVNTSPVRLKTKHRMNFGFLYFCKYNVNLINAMNTKLCRAR